MKNITCEEEYEYRYKNRTKKELDLADEYNCDGLCYGCRFMCPRAETCPETRLKEFTATIFAWVIVLGIPLLVIIAIIIGIILIFS